MEVVRRLLFLAHPHHGVFEREQHAGIDVEGQMQVERATAPFFGMEVDFPHLAQRVRLDEVSLIVNVEPVVDRVVLQVGHVAGHIDCCHGASLAVPLG